MPLHRNMEVASGTRIPFPTARILSYCNQSIWIRREIYFASSDTALDSVVTGILRFVIKYFVPSRMRIYIEICVCACICFRCCRSFQSNVILTPLAHFFLCFHYNPKIPTKHTEFKGGNAADFIQVNKSYLKDIESNTTQAIELQAQLQRESNALSRVKQRRKELIVKIKKIESGMETPHSLILDVLQDNNGTGSKSEGVGEEKEGIGTKWQEQVFPELKLHRCEPPLAPSLRLPLSVSKTSPSKLHEWMDSLSSPYDHE